MATSNYTAARRIADKVLNQEPLNITANFQICLLSLNNSDLKKAGRHARAVLKANPNEPNAWLNLGAVLQRQNRLSDAVRCYNKELLNNPSCQEAHFNLGICKWRQRRWEEAIPHLQECLRLCHSVDEIIIPLAQALFKCNRLKAEISLYEQCLTIDPGNLWARSNLGAALMDAGNTQRALIQLRIARSKGATFPNLIRNLHRLSKSRDQKGNTSQSAKLRLPAKPASTRVRVPSVKYDAANAGLKTNTKGSRRKGRENIL